MKEYAVLVDCGRKRDRWVNMAMRARPEIVDGSRHIGNPDRILNFYEIVHIEQLFRERYETAVDSVAELMGNRELSNNADLIIDGNGIGDVVREMMRRKKLYPIPVVATGGNQVHEVYATMDEVFGRSPDKLQGARTLEEIRVPKQDLVAAGSLLMQQRRMRIASSLRWAAECAKQLNAFKEIVNKRTRRTSFEAEDEDIHDDIVFCYLLGAWWFTRERKDGSVKDKPLAGSGQRTGNWDPFDYM